MKKSNALQKAITKSAQIVGTGALLALCAGVAQANLLTNGGFNDGDAFNGDLSSQVGWDFINDTFAVEDLNVFGDFGPVSHDGDGQSVKQTPMFGRDALAMQAIAATPGVVYTASAWAMNWTGNGITDPFGELGFMELSFQNAGGDTIGFDTVIVDSIDDGINTYLAPQDGADVSDWTQLVITFRAPARTTTARILLGHVLIGADGIPGGGTLRWDDVRIVPVPAALWLFGSGLLGLVGMARHKKA